MVRYIVTATLEIKELNYFLATGDDFDLLTSRILEQFKHHCLGDPLVVQPALGGLLFRPPHEPVVPICPPRRVQLVVYKLGYCGPFVFSNEVAGSPLEENLRRASLSPATGAYQLAVPACGWIFWP